MANYCEFGELRNVHHRRTELHDWRSIYIVTVTFQWYKSVWGDSGINIVSGFLVNIFTTYKIKKRKLKNMIQCKMHASIILNWGFTFVETHFPILVFYPASIGLFLYVLFILNTMNGEKLIYQNPKYHFSLCWVN